MTGQPPNQIGQSPERDRSSLQSSVTNDRLAGAATMLTHGVAAHDRTTIGASAYVPVMRTSLFTPLPARAHALRRLQLLTVRQSRRRCFFANPYEECQGEL
jgi:hypothetical protein